MDRIYDGDGRRFTRRRSALMMRAMEVEYRLRIEDLAQNSVEVLREKARTVDQLVADVLRGADRFDEFPSRDRDVVLEWLEDRRYRIEALLHARSQQAQLAAIQEQVDRTIPEPEGRHGIDAALAEAKAENEKLIRELQARDDEETRDKKRLENWRTKMEARIAMVQHEPAAILLGGGLAVAIALVMMVGMFMHTEAPTVLVNAFLLILGFFFGQNTGGGKSSGKSG